MAKKPAKKAPLTIMVSSTVYGIEELLDQIYAVLSGFGYEVWMSHKGTVPVYPDQTALESCLHAVEQCDLFLSIITPRYGSGVVKDDPSITHQELLKAIELKKPRWILAHDRVVFSRILLRKLGASNPTERLALFAKLGFNDPASMKKLRKAEELILDDFRVIDMYEAALRFELQKYQDRKGNWVQKFDQSEDVMLFATSQFSRYREVEQFLRDHFNDLDAVAAKASVNSVAGDQVAGVEVAHD